MSCHGCTKRSARAVVTCDYSTDRPDRTQLEWVRVRQDDGRFDVRTLVFQLRRLRVPLLPPSEAQIPVRARGPLLSAALAGEQSSRNLNIVGPSSHPRHLEKRRCEKINTCRQCEKEREDDICLTYLQDIVPSNAYLRRNRRPSLRIWDDLHFPIGDLDAIDIYQGQHGIIYN